MCVVNVCVFVSVCSFNKLYALLNKYPMIPFYPDPEAPGSRVNKIELVNWEIFQSIPVAPALVTL